MQPFATIDDVEDWLRPLGYEAFWRAMDGRRIFDHEDREHCDRVITNGIASYETVLTCIKAMACDALTARYGLKLASTLPRRPNLRVVD